MLISGLAGAPLLTHAGHGAKASSPGKTKSLSLLLPGPSPHGMEYVNTTGISRTQSTHGLTIQLQQSNWRSGLQKAIAATADGTLPNEFILGETWTALAACKHALSKVWSRRSHDTYEQSWAGSYNGTFAGARRFTSETRPSNSNRSTKQ